MFRIGHLKHPHWLFVAGYAGVLLLLYLAIGPLRQTSAYHQFVDVRVWCGVPRFGDVLSNGGKHVFYFVHELCVSGHGDSAPGAVRVNACAK